MTNLSSSPSALAQEPSASTPLRRLLLPGAVIFLANAGLLVLQLVASRILSPFIGSSLETWTAIIGAFLTGIALGNWLGGKIADRRATSGVLALLLALGGLATLVMVGLPQWLHRQPEFYRDLPWSIRIPVLSFALCLLPGTIISLLTPLTIRLALPDIQRVGRTAGAIYALSTLGCLIGNYLTGFVLLLTLPIDTIVFGIAGLLFLLSASQFALGRRAAIAAATAASTPSPTKRTSKPVDPKSAPLGMTVRNPFAPPAASAADPLTELIDDSPLRGWVGRACLIVFWASFCGMTLEMAGIRLLAPILGVSLYSVTGIIGVMLAATAIGNHLGGVLADRGPRPALRGLFFVAALLIGAGLAPQAFRYLHAQIGLEPIRQVLVSLDDQFGTGTAKGLVRTLGAALGVLAVWLGAKLTCCAKGTYTLALLVSLALGLPLGQLFAQTFPNNAPFGPLNRWGNALAEATDLPLASLPAQVLVTAVISGLAVALVIAVGASPQPVRRSGMVSLGVCLLLASAMTLSAMIGSVILPKIELIWSSSYVERILTYTFVLFFPPMLFLGTVSPQVIRLTVPDETHAGRIAGTVYAWSTVGAIVGTFATGFVLISQFGVARTILGASLILGIMALVVGRFWKQPLFLYGLSVTLGGIVTGLIFINYGGTSDSDVHIRESNYYRIRIIEDTYKGRAVKSMVLDQLIHSTVDPEDPTFLYYPHEEIQVEMTRVMLERRGSKPVRVLVIGGGGYTFPRYAVTQLPHVLVDVVEIDPAVTAVAFEHLGLRESPNLHIEHMDGRHFISEKALTLGRRYDLIIQDAVNDLGVPAHLMTKEYNDAIRQLLTDDGVYLLSVIDLLGEGRLWRAGIHTLRSTFSQVELLAPPDHWDPSHKGVYVIYASQQPFAMSEVVSAYQKQVVSDSVRTRRQWAAVVISGLAVAGMHWTGDTPKTQLLPAEQRDRFLEAQPPIVLTDQFAPVDALLLGVFRRQNEKRMRDEGF